MKVFCILIFFFIISFSSTSQKLPSLKATVFDSSMTGYYFLSSNYAGRTFFIILDHSGNVVYYKPMRIGTSAYNFSLNTNGLISYSNQIKYLFMDSTFNVVDTIACKNGNGTDPHDMRFLADGHYLLIGADTVSMDLSKDSLWKHWKQDKERDTILVRQTVIQELDENKKVVFEWHAKDHFAFDDADTFLLGRAFHMIDLEHANAVEMDRDGNILLSSRNFSEITKINHRDGSIMWRLGGKCNQFKFVNCPVPFYGQHDIRRISNGHITLFDGGHYIVPHGARALEFELDEKNKIATLKWSYIYDSTMYSKGRGNVQRLLGNNTLINYGGVDNDIVFVVVDSAGHKLFQLSSPDRVSSYRAFYYSSLPWHVERPEMTCFDSLGIPNFRTTKKYASYQWNDTSNISAGDAYQRTRPFFPVTKAGNYFVFVPYGHNGFIRSENVNVTDVYRPCDSLPTNKKKKLHDNNEKINSQFFK